MATEKEKEIDPNNWDKKIYKKSRPTIVLGVNYSGSRSTLLPFVEVEEGVQVFPGRVKEYIKRRKEMGLK